MPDKDLHKFREVLFADTALQETLWNIDDNARFTEVIMVEASKLGLEVTADDMESAVRAGNRRWIERWI